MTVEGELSRLSRLDLYAGNLWSFAWRLVEWRCGTGPSATLISEAERADLAGLGQCLSSRESEACEAACERRSDWSWCAGEQ